MHILFKLWLHVFAYDFTLVNFRHLTLLTLQKVDYYQNYADREPLFWSSLNKQLAIKTRETQGMYRRSTAVKYVRRFFENAKDA